MTPAFICLGGDFSLRPLLQVSQSWGMSRQGLSGTSSLSVVKTRGFENTLARSRFLSFKPRRTPPPSFSRVDVAPRTSPPLIPGASGVSKPTAHGGKGKSPGWISPHHVDYYGRVDTSALDHPHLLHGDPHMPISKLTRGDAPVILYSDPNTPAKEVDHWRDLERLPELLTEPPATDSANNQGDQIDDPLERDFGSVAADAIRFHLFEINNRVRNAETAATVDGISRYSPLQRLEQNFRVIDRLTAAPGSTEDLAFERRSKMENREFFRSGSVYKNNHILSKDNSTVEPAQRSASEFEKDHGADAVFSAAASHPFPYGKSEPYTSYHPDFASLQDNSFDDEDKWMEELDKMIHEEEYSQLSLGEFDEALKPVMPQKDDIDNYKKEKERTKRWDMLAREDDREKDREEDVDEMLEMIRKGQDPNQEAFGPWGEMTVKVDRVQKVERGGTTVRYRALLIGGNGNGAAGFGVGKALSPNEAVVKASKQCKRNVFYIERYLNSGLSHDLAGRHNSCRVHLRAVRPDYGLRGHPLISEILKHAGITDASSKSHGNRNVYNIVYATFKALMTHESLEEIAMKRGKKFLNLQRARRLDL